MIITILYLPPLSLTHTCESAHTTHTLRQTGKPPGEEFSIMCEVYPRTHKESKSR